MNRLQTTFKKPDNNLDPDTLEEEVEHLQSLYNAGMKIIYPRLEQVDIEVEDNEINFNGAAVVVISSDDGDLTYQVRFQEIGDRGGLYTIAVKDFTSDRLAVAAVIGYCVEAHMWEALP